MRKQYVLFVILLITVGLSACGAAPAEEPAAETSTEPAIMIMDPFARASMPNGAAYMSIMNEGGSDDTLISVNGDVADAVELHATTMDKNDVMQMRPVENIIIPAGGSATLEPGGQHVMLIGIQDGLAVGDKFTLTLNFEKSGAKIVEVEVREGMAMEHDMDNMDSDMEESEMEGDEMEQSREGN